MQSLQTNDLFWSGTKLSTLCVCIYSFGIFHDRYLHICDINFLFASLKTNPQPYLCRSFFKVPSGQPESDTIGQAQDRESTAIYFKFVKFKLEFLIGVQFSSYPLSPKIPLQPSSSFKRRVVCTQRTGLQKTWEQYIYVWRSV